MLKCQPAVVSYVLEHDEPTVLKCGPDGAVVYIATGMRVVNGRRIPVAVLLRLDNPPFDAHVEVTQLTAPMARQLALSLLEAAQRINEAILEGRGS